MIRVADVAKAAFDKGSRTPRKVAFNALLDLISNVDIPINQLENVTKLYQHFLPTIPKRPKTVWEWLASTLNPNYKAAHMRMVYVEGDNMTATNGHAVYTAPNTNDRVDGYYTAEGVRINWNEKALWPDTGTFFRNLDMTDGVAMPALVKLVAKDPRVGVATAYKLGDHLYDAELVDKALMLGEVCAVWLAPRTYRETVVFKFADGRMAAIAKINSVRESFK